MSLMNMDGIPVGIHYLSPPHQNHSLWTSSSFFTTPMASHFLENTDGRKESQWVFLKCLVILQWDAGEPKMSKYPHYTL